MRRRDRTYSGYYALLVLSVIVFATQCVEEYNPNIPEKDQLLVVDGSILQGNEQQTIVITRSTSIHHPEFIAVEGCQVTVTDDRNNSFYFEEETPGKYHAIIDSAYLEIGVNQSKFTN